MNVFGISNLNNNCWLNSLIQIILSCKDLHAYILKHAQTQNLIVYNEFARLANCTGTVISLDAQFIKFMSNFDNASTGPKCVDEALLYLFDKIGDNEPPFGIRERISIECSTCSHVEDHVDYLPFKQIYRSCNIFEDLINTQTFTNENHKCSKCSELAPATVTRNLISVRKYILFLTNGFTCTIPLQFSIGNFQFHLSAVVYYAGGHYYTCAVRDSKIYLFNDANYSEINQFIASHIYMLCYEKN